MVTDGQALLDAAAISKPDLVLLEIAMPPLNGIELTRRLRAISGATKVLILTFRDDPECVKEALRAGASGYVLKSCGVSDLVNAIHMVLGGQSYLTPSLRQRLAYAPTNLNTPPSPISLTIRQCEVLQLIAQGRTAKEIANALGLSVKTAVFHKVAIMDKLGLRTTAELTRYALEHGILSPKAKNEVPAASVPLGIVQPDTAQAW